MLYGPTGVKRSKTMAEHEIYIKQLTIEELLTAALSSLQ